MSVMKWWLKNYSKAAYKPASKYMFPTRLLLSRFIKPANISIILKLLPSADLFRRNYI